MELEDKADPNPTDLLPVKLSTSQDSQEQSNEKETNIEVPLIVQPQIVPMPSKPTPLVLRRKKFLQIGIEALCNPDPQPEALDSSLAKLKKSKKSKSSKKRKRDKDDKDSNSKPTKISKKSKEKFELPPGWVGKEKIRAATGESMGPDNLFYYSPSGQFFRSLTRVKEYLEKQDKKRRKKEKRNKSENTDGSGPNEEKDKQHKKKKKKKRSKEKKKSSTSSSSVEDAKRARKKKGKRDFLSVSSKESPKEKEVQKKALKGKELEKNIEAELKIAGENWVGKEVECYWAYPADQRGFYPGVIRQSRRQDGDVEYLVEYTGKDAPSPEWEVVDDGMRFLAEDNEDLLQQIIELRKERGTYVPVKVLERPSKRKLEKHTRDGDEFHVDLDFAFAMELPPEEEENRGGELVWDPELSKDCDIDRFLMETRIQEEPDDVFSVLPLVLPSHPNIFTKQQAFDLLHENQYDADRAIQAMEEKGVKWSEDTVILMAEWTAVEVLKFEFAMKQYGDPTVVTKHIPTKTFAQLMEFFWRWRASARYEVWLNSSELFHSVRRSLATEQERKSSRLRRRALRIDYSFSKLPTDSEIKKIIDLGLLTKEVVPLSSLPSPKRKRRKKNGQNLSAYDVGIYVDIYIQEDEEKLIGFMEESDSETGDISSVSDVSTSSEEESSMDSSNEDEMETESNSGSNEGNDEISSENEEMEERPVLPFVHEVLVK